MKRMILFALFLNAALLGVIALQLVALAGGDEGPVASVNGDTNGDGTRDVSDAIHLLSWLFTGGVEPVPVACAQDAPALTTEQAEILSYMSLVSLPVDDTGNQATAIRISGVNVQLVNGMGSTWGNQAAEIWDFGTHRTNGLGNLIIGYQETRSDDGIGDTEDDNYRIGSHNLVVGSRNNYSTWGSQVVGGRNTVGGWLSSASGGFNNISYGQASFVGGGESNYATGRNTMIGGGQGNTASARGSVVGGGGGNMAVAEFSIVAGGRNNTAEGEHSIVGGGLRNRAQRPWGIQLGGHDNSD